MGKYMNKSKTTGDVAVMDLTLGVRTRAKTLALQQLHSPAAAPYHLRSRSRSRHLKPPSSSAADSKRQKQSKDSRNPNPNSATQKSNRNGNGSEKASGPRARSGQVLSPGSRGPAQNEEDVEVEENVSKKSGNVKEEAGKDLGLEASFGENVLEIDSRERSTRESTPCSLIRDPETFRTPASTTRPTFSTENNRRMQRCIPAAQEMTEFFAKAEREQLQEFIKKYNFDPVNEKLLPGRYEWEKVDP